MLCRKLNRRYIAYGFISLNLSDRVTKDTETAKNADLSVVREESGWDRVKSVFKKSEYEEISLELQSILQVACLSSFAGAVYGGFLYSRQAYMDFIRNNQATLFTNHIEAKKKLQDKVTLGFAKGAFRWGWRLTLFCTTYMTVSTFVSTYRNKHGILEHVIAGATSGFLYQLQVGPKAWIVGAGLGVFLGAIGGSCTLALLKLSGMTMEETRYWQNKWKSPRLEKYKKEYRKFLAEEDHQLIKERDAKFKSGEGLDLEVKSEVTDKEIKK
ncbi:RPII140-upstream gene protein [Agrilus planipennis]|uniref:Complex I assembly factor TIMMDC1, mitochondrial n=1 Tax=Agrilus planipennis TaxID=224129 RepID=A0A1W4XCC4_AGRPL|nr:RPII140-upstream gene protein [Agrilus planipennis]